MKPSYDRGSTEYRDAVKQICKVFRLHVNRWALLNGSGTFRMRTDDAVAIWLAAKAYTSRELLSNEEIEE